MKRLFPTVLVAVILLGVTLWYLPSLLYLAYQTGAYSLDTRLDGRELLMKEGWVPVLNNRSWMARFLGNDPNVAMVAYIKIEGLKPGFMNLLVASTIQSPQSEDLLAVAEVRKYKWGIAKILAGSSPGESQITAVLPDFQLVATMRDLSALGEVESVRFMPSPDRAQ